jgi:hypothetical protein
MGRDAGHNFKIWSIEAGLKKYFGIRSIIRILQKSKASGKSSSIVVMQKEIKLVKNVFS